VVGIALCCGVATAQLPEDSGPYPAGVAPVSFSHALAANDPVLARIYYPAESEGTNTPPRLADGPYPLIGFSHGYFAPPQFYSELCKHLASHGYVVASIGTEAGLIQFVERQAHDTHALLDWMEEQHATSGAFFEGLLDDSERAVIGHSNGCVANAMILEWDEPFQTMIAMEPRMNDLPSLATFAGNLYVIAASNDIVNPPQNNAVLFYGEASTARRRTLTVIEGGGHNGSLDFPSAINPLSHAEQHRLHRRLVQGFLQTEVRGLEDECYHLLGGGAANDPLSSEALCADPILWVGIEGAELIVGGAGVPDLRWAVIAGPDTTPFASPNWFPGIDPSSARMVAKGILPTNGLRETRTSLPPNFPGMTLLFRGGAFSRTSVTWTRLAPLTVP
jgi:hypothetical protein